MTVFVLLFAATASAVGWLAAVLVRRKRRRGDVSADGLRIEAAASAGLREERRRARAGRDMTTASTDVCLRDR